MTDAALPGRRGECPRRAELGLQAGPQVGPRLPAELGADPDRVGERAPNVPGRPLSIADVGRASRQLIDQADHLRERGFAAPADVVDAPGTARSRIAARVAATASATKVKSRDWLPSP